MSDTHDDPGPATTLAELDRKLDHFAFRVESAVAAVGADVDGLRRDVVGVTDRHERDLAEKGRLIVLLDSRLRQIEGEVARLLERSTRPGIPWPAIVTGAAALAGLLFLILDHTK